MRTCQRPPSRQLIQFIIHHHFCFFIVLFWGKLLILNLLDWPLLVAIVIQRKRLQEQDNCPSERPGGGKEDQRTYVIVLERTSCLLCVLVTLLHPLVNVLLPKMRYAIIPFTGLNIHLMCKIGTYMMSRYRPIYRRVVWLTTGMEWTGSFKDERQLLCSWLNGTFLVKMSVI